jgi:hypothetical protein
LRYNTALANLSDLEKEKQEKLAAESTKEWDRIVKANSESLSAAERELEAEGGKVIA